MNTTMSTKRSFVTPDVTPKHEGGLSAKGWATLGLVGGLGLLAIGVVTGSTIPAAIGFMGFAPGFYYLNGMFWAKQYDSGKIAMPKSADISHYI